MILIIVAILLRKLNNLTAAVITLTKEEVEEFYFGDRNYDVLVGNFQPEKLPYKEDLKILIKDLEINDTVLGSAEDVAKGKCLAVFELSPFGNLKNYLKKYSAQHFDEPKNVYLDLGDELELQGTLQVGVLAYFCKQIAQGMEYMAQKNVFHGDLATRNVLVFRKYVVKITDFGMSRKLYDYAAYTKKKQVPLPWAWMALESLRFMKFSTETDVWSFAVTMWEIYSMGQTPYAGTVWTTVFADQVEAGQRLTKPKLAPDFIYNFMLACWENNPQSRPTFAKCTEFFSSLEAGAQPN
ncbi:unnamed protein product [Allacma fusca]|uniref:Protein kinase domain-containing protein n=1 Tax=Allacma fusca TaxID=39272 RepID=A0A8J2NU03_9HEXA|nr:unnamed protein product [Allacma fusca]